MSSTGQPCDNGVTRVRQEGDTLTAYATLGEVAGIPGYPAFPVTPYSDHALPSAAPSPHDNELYNTRRAIAYIQQQLEEDTALLRFTRLEAEAAAVRRELRELRPRTQSCLHCGTLFNAVKADGAVEVKVGKRRMYCDRKDDGSILGSEECIREREAQRQREYRARKKTQRQSD